MLDVIILSGGTSVLPLVIENHVLSEVPFLSHVVVVGERRDYLTCLMTLKVGCTANPFLCMHALLPNVLYIYIV